MRIPHNLCSLATILQVLTVTMSISFRIAKAFMSGSSSSHANRLHLLTSFPHRPAFKTQRYFFQRTNNNECAPQRRSRHLSTSSSSSSNNNNNNNEGSNKLKSYKVQGATSPTSKSGVIVSTDTGHTLRTDVPLRMGGKDEAAQPVETLLTALIGCTQATALFVGRQIKPQRIAIEKMEFHLQAFRDERGALTLPIHIDPAVPSMVQRIEGTVVVHATNRQAISQDSMQVLKEQTELRCPVASMMVASGCKMDIEWMDGSNK